MNNIHSRVKALMVAQVIICTCLADDNPFVSVPISPEAAAICAYGVYPAELYTGATNISIPIHEFNLEGKKFPISLSYTTKGIRVAQEASCVGLGWCIQGGGCITREIQGIDDFKPSYGFCSNVLPDSLLAYINESENGISTERASTAQYVMYDYAQKVRDAEPDIMHYTIPGYHGTMFLHSPKTEYIKGERPITLSPYFLKNEGNLRAEGKLSGVLYNADCRWLPTWTITDGDGYQYIFDLIEKNYYFNYTKVGGGCYRPSTLGYQGVLNLCNQDDINSEDDYENLVTSTWVLTKIIAPKGSELRFEYETEDVATFPQRQDLEFCLNDESSNLYREQTHEEHTYCFSRIKQQRLKRISSEQVSIEFNGNDRYDLLAFKEAKMPQCITSIIVSDTLGQYKKTFMLDYSYNPKTTTPNPQSRLYLSSVKTDEGVYTFNYSSTPLPDKDSNEYDDNGYYNQTPAASDRWSQSKHVDIRGCSTYIPQLTFAKQEYLGRSRVVDAEGCQAGVLKSVTYPSGLRSEFEYEPHQVDYYSDAYYTFKHDTIETEVVAISDTFGIRQSVYDGDVFQSEGFEVTTRGQYKVCYSIRLLESVNSDFDDAWNVYIIPTKGSNEAPVSVVSIKIPQSALGELYEGSYLVTLDPGQYQMNFAEGTNIQHYANIRLSTYQIINSQEIYNGDNHPWFGGLRIKAIANYDGEKRIAKTEYLYNPGVLMNSHAAYAFTISKRHSVYEEYLPYHGTVDFGTFLVGSSYTFRPFANSMSGYDVCYSKVTERTYIDDETYTDIISYFHAQADGIDSVQLTQESVNMSFADQYPHAIVMPDLANGDLLQRIYQNSNQVLRKEIYEYDATYKQRIEGIYIYYPSAFLTDNINLSQFWSNNLTNVDVSPKEMCLTYYNYPLSRKLLKVAKTTSDYTPSGTMTWTEETQYTEDNDQPNVVTTTTLDSTRYTITRLYCTNPESENSDMLRANMKNIPIETIKSLNGKVVDAERTVYDVYPNYLILPQRYDKLHVKYPVYYADYSSDYQTEVTADQYDLYGNVLQTTDRSGVPTAYIWGYNHNYLIASVRNLTREDLEKEFDNIEDIESSYLPDIDAIDQLRGKIGTAYFETYTYDALGRMTSKRDVTGLYYSYKYDAIGRLVEVHDLNDALLQKYEYHYANQE
jgi:YD repeat-containing protein